MVKRGATQGAYRIHSRHSLSRNRVKEEGRLRQEEAQTVDCKSCKSNRLYELKREEEEKDGKRERENALL